MKIKQFKLSFSFFFLFFSSVLIRFITIVFGGVDLYNTFWIGQWIWCFFFWKQKLPNIQSVSAIVFQLYNAKCNFYIKRSEIIKVTVYIIS